MCMCVYWCECVVLCVLMGSQGSCKGCIRDCKFMLRFCIYFSKTKIVITIQFSSGFSFLAIKNEMVMQSLYKKKEYTDMEKDMLKHIDYN